MPRFFFDTYDNGHLASDPEGLEMESFEAARSEAVASLAEKAKDELPDGDRREFSVVVRNERGETVLRATLSFKVELGSR